MLPEVENRSRSPKQNRVRLGERKISIIFRECENGDQGKKLQQIDADRTENTWPAWAESIPWLLFNNLSLASLQPDIIDTKSALCILYFNKNKFEACK